jgi:LPXTG-site transpeptidase (sortase) family protein
MNPLFPDDPQQPVHTANQDGYVLPRQERHLDPLPPTNHSQGAQAATELIRRKIDTLYRDEPAAGDELQDARTAPVRSKHQQYMYELSTSGKSLADIQTAWHVYYTGLSDDEKRAVWQEFYAANGGQTHSFTKPTTHRANPIIHSRQGVFAAQSAPAHPVNNFEPSTQGMVVVSEHQPEPQAPPAEDRRSFAAVKRHVLKTVRSQNAAEIRVKQHLQSLAFGLGSGALVLLVVLFSFFNEVVITPFITPGSHSEATPIILNADGIAPSDKSEVIIPKINAQLPFMTGTSVVEADIEKQLEEGIAHYPTTARPGQQGNAAFFGHSSNNIFNKGKYKFAFVLLHELEPGDIFYLTNGGKAYTYKVFQKKVVEPTETWVLNPVEGKTATAVLITCDPPGTSLRRLVVWGEQVSPDPNGNTAAPATTPNAEQPQELPSDSPTLWSRFYHWATPW